MILSGFGNYPKINANIYSADKLSSIQSFIQKNRFIARGLGRSYGDSALYENVFSTDRLRYILDFDPQKGIVTCEAGVSLKELIETFVPKGWFLGVVPGTQFVTVGGAIASDIHGKNHHIKGCFSEFVICLQLLLPNGEKVICSRNENSELFYATCSGMGLTGIILAAKIQLIPITSSAIKKTTIKAKNLDEILILLKENQNASYSVAWIDCMTRGPNFGRSLLFLGEHAETRSLHLTKKKNISIPFFGPSFLLNRFTISVFNALYYSQARQNRSEMEVDLVNYFFPLDSIINWNRLYGKNGFLQYQFVLPEESSRQGIKEILKKIADYGGGSFLSVLKLLGNENLNYLSFPMSGYTLALDFKIESKLFEFLNQLDNMVEGYQGRVYLTKDARMSRTFFESTYPKLEKFKNKLAEISALKKIISLQAQRLGIIP